MSWPALEGLADRHEVTLYGPDALRPFWDGGPWRPPATMPRGEYDAAVLFAPSFRAAWEARLVPRRIGTPTDHRRWLLTEAVAPRAHRSDTYRAVAGRLGASHPAPPRLRGPPAAGGPAHVGLNPIVKGGRTRQWTGFAALADVLARRFPVRFYAGPGEGRALAAVAPRHPQSVGLPLRSFAAALGDCRVFVSNDAGSAHFAAALGVRVVVLYGSTRPEHTGPAGAWAVQGPSLPCVPCYRNRCRIRTFGCLDIALNDVVAAVEAAWDS
ncbi:MAG: glycosyltransferase family 9 protein [Myxococcota bacterium]